MAKTKFFRVAVEGATTDGRVIERSWIQEMADTYNPATYGARINMEHIKGYSPEAPFNAYGDVLTVKAEEVPIELGGKTEKKLALFAELDVTDELVALNGKKQKLYTSIEVNPNMAGTGKAYLMGLAVTDNPASLGTEMLAFAAKAAANPFAERKQAKDNLFTAATEFTLELAEAPKEQESPFDKVVAAFAKALSPAPAPAVEQKLNQLTDPNAAVLAAFSTFSTDLTAALKADRQALAADFKTQIETVKADLTAFKGEVEKTPSPTHRHRAAASGGDGRILADF